MDLTNAHQIIKMVPDMTQHQIETTIIYLYDHLDQEHKTDLKNNFRFKEGQSCQ